FPMKFFEYLAAGLPVVAIRIPALLPYQNALSLCETKEEFVIAIDRALASLTQHEDVTKRQALASQNTYKYRTEKMLMLIKDTIE
ncbi:MAG: glycosyltransferase family 1 protein, partial [Prochlorococcus sp.]